MIYRPLNFLKCTLLGGAILIVNPLFSQTIDYANKSKEEIAALEQSHHSVITDTIDFAVLKNPPYDLETTVPGKAILYKRSDDTFDPQLYVWYHYDPDLNKLLGITYNWGLFNPSFNPGKEKKRLEGFTKREDEFVEKYNSLQKELQDKLGKPTGDKIIADNKSNLIKEVFWVGPEKTVELSMRFARKLREIPGVGLMAHFEISVMTSFKD